MSNRSSSHNHGHAFTNILRKKSKLRDRKNKATAAVARTTRQAEQAKVYADALVKISA